MVRVAGSAAARHLRSGSVRSADHLLGLGLAGPRVTTARVSRLLGRLPPGITEWVVHPVAPSRSFEIAYPWGLGWGRELDALCDPEVLDALDDQGVRVVGFSREEARNDG